MISPLQDLLGRRPSVMVVDDDEDLLLVLQLTLEEEGFQVMLSANARQLFELLSAERPDIMLLDITMDGVDGSDICREIKINPALSKLPIVLFSANRNVAEIAVQCGAEGFISKPFEVKELANTLSSLIKTQIH